MQRRGFDFFRKLSNPSSDNFAQLTESISLFLLQVKLKNRIYTMCGKTQNKTKRKGKENYGIAVSRCAC